MVKETGSLAGVDLRPHDLRRYAATWASPSGVPIEIVRGELIMNLAYSVYDDSFLAWPNAFKSHFHFPGNC